MQGDLTRRPTLGGVLAAAIGLALFIYFLRRAGVADVADGVRRLGWMFLVVVALGGVRFLVRAAAWLRCLDGPHRLTLAQTFQAVVAGDSLGNLTPLSIIVSEPAKGMFLRHREPLRRTLPALAVENLFYTLSAMFVIGGGLVAVFLMFQTSGQLWLTITVLVGAMVGLVATAHWVIWRHWLVGSAALDWLQSLGVAPRTLARVKTRVRRLEEHVHTLYPRDWGRLGPLALLEFSFHALAVLEVFLILSVVSDQPTTILHAFVFESTGRFISFAFRFVPLRIGVDEAGSGIFADLLALGTATGVTLAIVRKGRILAWIAIGVLFLVRHGLSVRRMLASRATEVAVVIMARSPVSGDPPKTRLASVIDAETHRRRLYSAFLQDTVEACRTLEGSSLRVAYAPDGGTAGFSDLGIADDELLIQRGDDLGQREEGVFADLFVEGFAKVVMIGSDLPTLPTEHLRQAIDAVDPQTVVLGPAEDGGYYLIALASDAGATDATVPDLFSNVRWSTPETLDDTWVAAIRADLRVELLPSWYDIDDAEGLERLRAELGGDSGRDRSPETRRALKELFEVQSETGRQESGESG
jgi:rSAM/selenodomain-associated transferase 1